MRIIKEGRLPEIVFVGHCYRCGTQFEADASETRTEHDDGQGRSWTAVTCPTCGNSVSVRETKREGVAA